jgi:hypothetical protein
MGTGGWRYGAGRPGYRGKCEAALRIDVRELHRRNLLHDGLAFPWYWTNTATGERAGNVGCSVEGGVLVLAFTMNDVQKRQRVTIERTACTFGGTRPWLLCPHCSRRVAVLYCRRGGFYCRACAQVSYLSQSEDVIGRTWLRQQKAERLLGLDGRPAPRRLSAKERERLIDVIVECEDRREVAVNDRLLPLLRRLGEPLV